LRSFIPTQLWTSSNEGSIAAINLQFFNHLKCLDLIFKYLSGLMISIKAFPELMDTPEGLRLEAKKPANPLFS